MPIITKNQESLATSGSIKTKGIESKKTMGAIKNRAE
jgi:hypothetical protein